ncbi:MAG: hypothetical protein WCY09_08000 [Candidatus Omnitrophota bacterium]|jgi:hypothetical protein
MTIKTKDPKVKEDLENKGYFVVGITYIKEELINEYELKEPETAIAEEKEEKIEHPTKAEEVEQNTKKEKPKKTKKDKKR